MGTLNTYQVIDDADDLPAGSILLMNGCRYKTAAAQTSGSGEGGIALTETFAGSSYLELCSGCADSLLDDTGGDGGQGTNTDTGSVLNTDGNFGGGFDLRTGEQLMLGSATKFDAQMSVVQNQVGIFDDAFTGTPSNRIELSSTAGALGTKAASIAANSDVAIYKVHNTAGYKPVIVTESASTPTTSTSPSAPTVALATAPPASAAASRATPTTTATPRTCSPPKSAASAQSRSAAVRASK